MLQIALVRMLVLGLVLGLSLGLVLGLSLGLIGGLFFGLIGGLIFGLSVGLSLGLSLELIAERRSELGECIKHLSLRIVLYRNGYAPWNYARFLNYCTDHLLLQRVGGRYRFMHKLLQEHFAAMPFEKP